MTHYIHLCDNDVLYLDEDTGNIVVSIENLPPRMFEGDVVFINFKEDPETIQHKFTVVEFDNKEKIATFDYVDQLGESLLTEAPKFVDKLKNIFNPDQATKLAAGQKAAEKAEKKIAKNFADLAKRDIARGKPMGWLFYIQLPNGTYLKTPMEFKDVALFYNDGNNLSPAIVNAVVTLSKPDDFIMRKGKADYSEAGIRFAMSELNVPSNMKDEWEDGDKDHFIELVEASTDKLKNAVKAQMIEEEQTKQKPEKSTKYVDNIPTNDVIDKNKKEYNQISQSTYRHFMRLLCTLKPKTYDESDNIIDLSSKDEVLTKLSIDNLNNIKIEVDGKPVSAIDWIKNAVKENILVEKVLNEAPQIVFSPEDTNNPDEINFKKIIQRETEKEQRAEAEKAVAAKEAEFREKYAPVYEELKTRVNGHESTIDTLEYLFENMVPSSGAADSVAGEYVRAMMRILYRDYNDGDKFFTGYGIETCGSSAEWLHDNGLLEEVESIVEDAYRLEDDDKYTAAITDLAQSVLHYLLNHEELFYKANDDDSRDYTTEYIEEVQLRYEFECYGSDDIVTLVENGAIGSWELVDYVNNFLSYERVFEDAECSRPWGYNHTSVTVENLTKEGYERLEDIFNRDVNDFWQDLVDEHVDELNPEEDEEDYDEYDDDMEED